MKIVCQKSDLLASVNIVMRAIPAKTTMTILECMVIEANDSGIKFMSNDMELAIETYAKGECLVSGTIAINAKVFSEIVRKLPESDVTIQTDDQFTMFISCEKSNFRIAGKPTDEFPVIPNVERQSSFVLSQFTLKEVIRQTVFSISDNESNKLMTGELFDINGEILRVISLDGHRISLRKITLKENYGIVKKVVVPGKTLNEISKILTGEAEDEVQIILSDKHILFEFTNTLVLSRLIEGDYYKVDQMITKDYENKIIVNKRELLSSIDRATLLIRESEKKPIILKITGNSMELQLNSALGSMKEEIDIEKEGRDILIGFNPKFLMDCLRVIDEETVTIYMMNPKAPCYIVNEEETYLYLVLPVNFNADAYN